MSTPAPYFFISYNREDADLQQKIIAELRARGLSAWVDVENLIPGSPAWEREIERSIRAAAGVIVLLSPDSNNSEWVRREISFAEQNEKRIFPVLVKGNEDASIPLRLSNHQRVDLRRDFERGLDGLANALRDHLGITLIGRRKPQAKQSFPVSPAQLRKFALPGVIALIALACVAGLTMFARFLSNYPSDTPTPSPTRTASATEVSLTPVTITPVTLTSTAILINTHLDEPTGKIVYTCQIAGDEVCLMNADGSGWRQLTNSSAASYYGSLSPDGQAVLYISKGSGHTEIYELNLLTGKARQLTRLEREVGSPEISPDNQWIAFTYRGNNNIAQVWIMNRDGSNPHKFYSSSNQEAHDPAWSPDGTRILFAMGKGENNKLYVVGLDGHDPQVVNETIDTRGRSDWSINNIIAFDMGGPFQHDIYVMNMNGSQLEKLSDGNNSQGASFSPDGKWMAFTAYTNVVNKDQASCEIYIIRTDGTDARRLTSNAYCDYQPRWGN
jgi:hypothetical protein